MLRRNSPCTARLSAQLCHTLRTGRRNTGFPFISCSSRAIRAYSNSSNDDKYLVKGSPEPAAEKGLVGNIVPAAKSISSKFDLSKIEMTPLERVLVEMIQTTGPLSLAAYMKTCLTSPEGGYYMFQDPLGRSGDFVTSPEISQMFGEMCGIWFVSEYINKKKKLASGAPSAFRLVEFGPGKGTLMHDMLTAIAKFPVVRRDLKEIVMVEASPTLRQVQYETLCGGSPLEKTHEHDYRSQTKWGIPIRWVKTGKDLAESSGEYTNFIMAHEFFDALPILSFEKTPKGWREYVVDYKIENISEIEGRVKSARKAGADLINAKIHSREDRLPNQSVLSGKPEDLKPVFHLTLQPHSTPSSRIVPQTHSRYAKLPENSKVEICPEAWEFTELIQGLLKPRIEGQMPGSAVIIDYGPPDTIPVDSFRAIRDHKFVSPFLDPGKADLSADVDFGAIRAAVEKNNHNSKGSEGSKSSVAVFGPAEQGDWLHALGIGYRADEVLKQLESNPKGLPEDELEALAADIKKSYFRLVEKSGGGMGRIYKVLALVGDDGHVPVGFGGGVAD